MTTRTTNPSYDLISKLLHWSMAILLTGLFAVGLYMTGLDYYDPLYHSLPWWHKSIGLLTLFLLFIRIIWKLTTTEPKPLKTHKKWEKSLSHFLQKTFYLLIFLIGISGYFISTAEGKGIDFFGWFEIPAILPELSESQADLVGEAHEFMAILLAILVGLHAAAALKHHFIDKDETLKRMI